MKKNSIVQLLESGKTVFTTQNLALLWDILDTNYLKTKIYRLVALGKLKRVRRGLFVLNENYNIYELANKLMLPSYVSLSLVLAQSGVINQYDSAVYSVGERTATFVVDDQKFIYRKIKDDLLLTRAGIEYTDGALTATLERAILDTLYLEKDCYFDNPGSISWDRCFELAPFYNDKTLLKRLTKLYEIYNGQKKA